MAPGLAPCTKISIVEDFATDPDSILGDWLGAGPLGVAVMQTGPGIGKHLDFCNQTPNLIHH